MSVTKCILFDEILSGYIMKYPDQTNSICSNCLQTFEPKIYYIENDKDSLDLKEIRLFSPMQLIEKIDNIIREKGEMSFYKENEWSETYWNIVFYFHRIELIIRHIFIHAWPRKIREHAIISQTSMDVIHRIHKDIVLFIRFDMDF